MSEAARELCAAVARFLRERAASCPPACDTQRWRAAAEAWATGDVDPCGSLWKRLHGIPTPAALREVQTETRTAWVEPAGDGVVLGFDGVLLDIPDPVRLAVGLDVGAIHVDVYSGDGGSAFAAAELVGLLTARALAGVRVTAHVRGQAASAHAELIALVPGKRSMAASARLMLHAPRMPALLGSEDELRQAAEVLAATRSLMAERLARRTGQPLEVVSGWLKTGDRWFSSADALACGLVDELIPDAAE